jgi:hypothetical protein
VRRWLHEAWAELEEANQDLDAAHDCLEILGTPDDSIEHEVEYLDEEATKTSDGDINATQGTKKNDNDILNVVHLDERFEKNRMNYAA